MIDSPHYPKFPDPVWSISTPALAYNPLLRGTSNRARFHRMQLVGECIGIRTRDKDCLGDPGSSGSALVLLLQYARITWSEVFHVSISIKCRDMVINLWSGVLSHGDQSFGIEYRSKAACERVMASRRSANGAVLFCIDCKWPCSCFMSPRTSGSVSN